MNQSDEIKRSSLSSRASKIPQKLVQASYFLRPSTSSLTPTPIGLDNERFTTRIGHMLWRQRPNESILRQSKSNSTEGFNDSKVRTYQ
jgi:hypothetical protein